MKRITPRPGVTKKNSTKIGPPYICQQKMEIFEFSIKVNLRVFQNHTKQAKINSSFSVSEPMVKER